MKLTQDTLQRIQTTASFCLESYKVLMGTFLLFFVPQICTSEFDEEYNCSITDIYKRNDMLSIITQTMNGITFAQIILFYYIELKRENWSIRYLDIDVNIPNNNLDTEIEKYPTFKNKIHTLNKLYRYCSVYAFGWIIINFVLSSYTVLQYTAGTNTITALLSYFILLSMKMYTSYYNAYYSLMDERVYSAYLMEHKTFNVIDKDHRIPVPTNLMNQNSIEKLVITDSNTPDILSTNDKLTDNEYTDNDQDSKSVNDIILDESNNKLDHNMDISYRSPSSSDSYN